MRRILRGVAAGQAPEVGAHAEEHLEARPARTRDGGAQADRLGGGAVGLEDLVGCLVPAEARGLALAKLGHALGGNRVGGQGVDGAREAVRVAGGDEGGSVAEHLGERGGAGGDDRRAAGHGLERREAEALVEGGEDEDRGGGVEQREVGLADGLEDSHPGSLGADARPQRLRARPGAQDEREVGVELRKRVEELADVLVGLGVAHVENEAVGQAQPPAKGLERGAVGAAEGGVDAVVDHADAAGREGEPLLDFALREAGDGEHQLGAQGAGAHDVAVVEGVEAAVVLGEG